MLEFNFNKAAFAKFLFYVPSQTKHLQSEFMSTKYLVLEDKDLTFKIFSKTSILYKYQQILNCLLFNSNNIMVSFVYSLLFGDFSEFKIVNDFLELLNRSNVEVEDSERFDFLNVCS